MTLKRRDFNKLLVASVGGILSGAQQRTPFILGAYAEGTDHVCAGRNDCSGQGGCESGDNSCPGKNSCKGHGGCATVAKHDCGGKNECKGMGGCKGGDNGCAGKNSCKGHGGCEVPVPSAHMEPA